MKFIHVSDLHLGKKIYGVSLIESGDQQDWVERFLGTAKETKPDAVVISGDVYDRSEPSGDAVTLFDHMITGLAEQKIPVMFVAGNHDSGQRLSFARMILKNSGIHVSGTLEKKIPSVKIPSGDGGNEVTFWLLPYVFPALVSQVLEDPSIHDYDTAVRRLLAEQDIDFTKKNVLVAHQNVAASGKEVPRGGSETMVGGVGQIDYTAFDGFTYVALGHIHSSYPVGRPEVRYAGSPLYYHFDELKQPEKGPLMVEIKEDGTVSTTLVRIPPLHGMRDLKGAYSDIKTELETNMIEHEYLRIVLTDTRITPEISAYLHDLCDQRGSVLMELTSDHHEFTAVTNGISSKEAEEKPVEDLFLRYFAERNNGAAPDEKEQEIIREAGELLRNYRTEGSSTPMEKETKQLLKFILEQEEGK